jgi:thiamine-phosphate pyrophosphorylase
VTDRRRTGAVGETAQRDCLLQQTAFAVAAGVDVIQVRERDLPARHLCGLVADVVAQARGSRTRVVVNDRIDVAVAAKADGVHLRGDSIPPNAVRPLVPAGFLIGRSVHSVDEALHVHRAVDYLIAGTVWPSRSKAPNHPLLGTAGLGSIARASNVPVLAIGGVTLAALDQLGETGAAGAAAIDLFWPEGGTSELCRAVPLVEVVREARARFDRSR